jgi:hypothetical protein
VHGTTGEKPCDRLIADQAGMQPYAAPSTIPTSQPARHWPRYPLQRSPKEYDRVLQEVTA